MIWTRFHIPPDWTGEQAKAVWELLDEISTAVWDAHEEKILDAMNREETRLERAARGDDPPDDSDFPF